MKPNSIAAVVIAKNERDNIERCLKALVWCSEVLVIDDHSTDGTAELAVNCGAKVIAHRFESFARQRNWALEAAGINSEWVLMLDADEVATDAFRNAVLSAIARADEQVAGFQLCRKTMFFGHWLRYSDSFPVWIMRIVRRHRACFHDSGHGEVPVPEVDGILPRIHEPFLHYPFSKGLSDWWHRHNRYSTREAEREWHESQPVRVVELLGRDPAIRRRALRDLARKLPCRGWLRFFYHFVWQWGFLDGRPGREFSRLMATYEQMIVQKKWEIAMRRQGRDP